MNLLKKIGLIGVALGTLAVNANAGVIRLYNLPSGTSGVGNQNIYMKNLTGASEGYMPFDVDYSDPTQPTSLTAYTKVEGSQNGKLSTDSKEINTSGWDFYLGVKGSVSGIDNYLRYAITDKTGLEGKTLVMYDTSNPSVTHPLLMDGAYHNINLPNLTASNTEYAHWRLVLAPIGDANLDGVVDAADYIAMKRNFGTQTGATWSQGDFDGDKDVDYTDLQTLMGAFGNTGGIVSAQTPANTPEPATIGILALGGLAGILTRKKR